MLARGNQETKKDFFARPRVQRAMITTVMVLVVATAIVVPAISVAVLLIVAMIPPGYFTAKWSRRWVWEFDPYFIVRFLAFAAVALLVSGAYAYAVSMYLGELRALGGVFAIQIVMYVIGAIIEYDVNTPPEDYR